MAGDDRTTRFEEFFRDHHDAVPSHAASRADVDTAKDAVAATFLVAWRRHGEERDHPLPWLQGVTRKTLAGLRRSATRFGGGSVSTRRLSGPSEIDPLRIHRPKLLGDQPAPPCRARPRQLPRR